MKAPKSTAPEIGQLAPITATMSSRLIVLANLLRRSAALRHRRAGGLSSVEFGLVASLGRNASMSVARLADAVGIDKAQISRALAQLVARKIVAKKTNPLDTREVLVSLTASGLKIHDEIFAGARHRNQFLLEGLNASEMRVLSQVIDRLTQRAEIMLDDEKSQTGE